MWLFLLSNLNMGASAPGTQVSFYLPYEFTSVLIAAGNVNPFDIDPDQTTLITTGNVNPFDIDPDQTTLITTGTTTIITDTTVFVGGCWGCSILIESSSTTTNTDPFGIDPEQTTIIINGLSIAITPIATANRLLQNSFKRLLENGFHRELE